VQATPQALEKTLELCLSQGMFYREEVLSHTRLQLITQINTHDGNLIE
jgi:hypothetical protein